LLNRIAGGTLRPISRRWSVSSRVGVGSLRLADPVAEAGHGRSVDAGVTVHLYVSTDGLEVRRDEHQWQRNELSCRDHVRR